ncbi:rhodanese-like domain-containing protein [Ponticaulis koreensis]|uniref:rhodanese-like domain-containing protein n=1 Tax=Ponticaulis koreensis TaxID=1123045 RepID=UPI0003B2F35A|nr:rhodanese family protein [Ponticaulis koreensis]
MESVRELSPQDIVRLRDAGEVVLVDVRETPEHTREHIKGAQLCPLSRWGEDAISNPSDVPVVFFCRSGMRTRMNANLLADAANGNAILMDGGLIAWKKAGLSVERARQLAPPSIMRQVFMVAGILILIGVILSQLTDSRFVYLSGFVGAGLLFAGVSGWCGMAKLLALMPWNKEQAG